MSRGATAGSERIRSASADRPRTGPGGSQLPPGPAGRRFSGNLGHYEADRLGFLLHSREEYGDVVAFDPRTTLVHGPDLARRLLQDPDGALVLEQDYLQRVFTDERLAAAMARRRHLSTALRAAEVGPVVPLVQAQVTAVVERLIGSAPLDPVPVLEHALARATVHHLLGSDDPALAAACTRLLDALAEVVGNPLVLPGRLSPARHRVARRYREVAFLVAPHVRAALSAPSDGVLAAALAGGAVRDPDGLSELVIGTLLAAQRVPAAAAAWMLLQVAERPGLESELLAEALTLDTGLTDLEVRAPCSRSVVLETLRLHPTTWVIMREVRSPLEIAGYRLGPGHHVLVSPWVLHRDEREWPRALEFDPGRWRDGAPPTGVYLPFGVGRHVCPGRHAAVLTLQVVLLTLVRWIEWSRGPGTVTPDPRTTLLPRGLRLAFRSRASG